jgi:hypothetical protein
MEWMERWHVMAWKWNGMDEKDKRAGIRTDMKNGLRQRG